LTEAVIYRLDLERLNVVAGAWLKRFDREARRIDTGVK
jgi:hypothetical protein